MASHRDELGRALGRHLQALAESAAGAGLLRDGEPADTGADLAMTAKARVTARRDDIAEVRRRLASVQESEQARKLAETELGKARQALDDCDQACRDAEQGLAAARAEVAGQLRGWAARWAGDQPSAILDESGLDALTGALDRAGEPDAATLTETFTALTQAADRHADQPPGAAHQRRSPARRRAGGPDRGTAQDRQRARRRPARLRPAARRPLGTSRRAALAAGPVRRRARRRGRRRDRRRAVRGGHADRLDPSRPRADHGRGRGGRGGRVPAGRPARGAARRADPGRRARPRRSGPGPAGRGGGSTAVGFRCGRSERGGRGGRCAGAGRDRCGRCRRGDTPGAVQLRVAAGRPAQGRAGVHRGDRAGQPAPRPARRTRPADRGPGPSAGGPGRPAAGGAGPAGGSGPRAEGTAQGPRR